MDRLLREFVHRLIYVAALLALGVLLLRAWMR